MRLRRRTVVVGAALALALAWTVRQSRSSRRLPVAETIVVTTAYVERPDTLRATETLSHLFARHNITGAELVAVLDAAEGLNPRRVRAGQVFRFRYASDIPAPDEVTVRLGDQQLLTLRRDTARVWRGETLEIGWTVDVRRVAGSVRSSLYETIHAAIPDSVLGHGQRSELVWDLADGVFGWVADFARDNYAGDDFQIVYERIISDLGDVRFGRILTARVETRGSPNVAYVMTAADGRNAYYDADGRSLKRAFKLYPAEFRRISSGFSTNRFHPVLRTSRPHLGVDYAAASGTPIIATGDGTVSRASGWGGYGLVVAIQHARGIETRYAHLRSIARGIRPGVRVTQGQTIGYVGMSGLANGPHLHYEFIQNGRHIDPRQAIRFGNGDPVPEGRRAEFEALRAQYDRMLESPRPLQVAAGTH